MLRSLLTAEKYVAHLEKLVGRFGHKHLLACKKTVVFYSGPSGDVRVVVGDDPLYNWERCARLAKAVDGSLIDDTIFGDSLFKRDIKKQFKKVYVHTKDPDEEANKAYLKVWGYISDLFARRDFEHAATVVCGADSSRVFVKYELPALVENTYVKTINGIDARAVRDMYACVGADEAFNLICRSELKALHERISDPRKTSAEFELDYKEQLQFYHVERDETAKENAKKGILGLTAAQEKEKQRIISEYGLKVVYDDLPDPLPSPSKPCISTGGKLGAAPAP